LESKYVGETPKNIQKVFADAKQHDAVLVFDEADSFLGKRLTSVTQAADYGVNVTRSTMFMEIENYSGIVIFTTNLIRNYDAAFMRRILASVEFALPDQNGRQVIWGLLLPKDMPLSDAV
ncbi:MAG TPA: ATP-binding protein, partial [Firmicutes bacterium]|nr:ATP-binding protein [Bacillota bacterium]